MNIDELTIGQAKELAGMFSNQKTESKHFFRIGENYFIRTVTNYYTGILVDVSDKEILLKNCSWIASTGRFSDAINEGVLDEVEPYQIESEVVIGRLAIIDACVWKHELPKDQK